MDAQILAADPGRGTVFVDYIGLFVPLGVVVAAVIAAGVALWNERKAPYRDLQALIAIAKDWPDQAEGLADIEAAIQAQLARVRVANNITSTQPGSRKAERHVRQSFRWATFRFLGTLLVLWVFSIMWVYKLGQVGLDGEVRPWWYFWTVMGLFVIGLIALIKEIDALFEGDSAIRMLWRFLRSTPKP
ncbi:hypothetical protein GFY24_25140 [Nocardia sp. SYP-A9097]|uniref:hypothetical protein n=1 Tax=Nocardia sp. SYP-A9097 TaxID=2663237 RepID=UPI00129AAC4C|nr:hypothetical protein [Nocardia sp. SYP-A9097]MRH90686.1 hypothetical protein [Nocardia sp. SYP-A9097]